ncbi:hypothetical protein C478_17671 [Natrinema thermotolerans DSM 11552]|nr:hypothetical protein C478_17671 [Natrinema thermotolerans DSM 11552]
MSDHETNDAEEYAPSLAAIDSRIVLGAAAVGVFVSFTSLLVPVLTRVGGGIVAGFIAAYAAGRVVTGLAYAVVASALVGGLAGFFMAFLGALSGLYTEPPLFVLSSVGPVSPGLSGLGLPSVILLAVAFSLLTAIDGLVGGLVGSGLRALSPW